MRIIKILTDKDVDKFNKAAPKHEIVMAGFFMVNCPACEAFKPEWKNFVKSCKSEENPEVLIAEVDSNKAGRINFDTSALEGFPTVYRDVKGEKGVVEFKHARTKKALRRFLKEAMVAKGGRRKSRKKKRKMKSKKKKRKTKRKRRGGDNSHCAQASLEPPLKTKTQADAWCKEYYSAEGKTKCDITIGECKQPLRNPTLDRLRNRRASTLYRPSNISIPVHTTCQNRSDPHTQRTDTVRAIARRPDRGGYKKRKTQKKRKHSTKRRKN